MPTTGVSAPKVPHALAARGASECVSWLVAIPDPASVYSVRELIGKAPVLLNEKVPTPLAATPLTVRAPVTGTTVS